MLGQPDPIAMLDEMDETTFQGWLNFYRVSPFGHDVDHRMMARVAAAVALNPGEEDAFLPRLIDG